MPDDRETWHLALGALEHSAQQLHRRSFAECDADTREAMLRLFAKGELGGGAWAALNVSRAWSVCSRMALDAFYSHPWAWNEIGFGGPAYPRGYMRMGGVSTREPFERPGATDEDPVQASTELER
jgi:hypothetical protein